MMHLYNMINYKLQDSKEGRIKLTHRKAKTHLIVSGSIGIAMDTVTFKWKIMA